MCDAKQVMEEYGMPIRVRVRDESEVVRDRYQTIKRFDSITPYDFKAYPVDFSPNRYRLQAAGLFEEVEVLIYTSMWDWLNIGFTFSQVDIERTSVYMMDNMYNIREKGLASQFAESYLYVTLGLWRK